MNQVSCPKIKRAGSYYRTSDAKRIQKFHCNTCDSNFSSATFGWLYRQRKRKKHSEIKKLLSSGVTQRRAAEILKINRKTLVRKFMMLSLEAEFELKVENLKAKKCSTVEFDDLETFEHTKCKPLSVTLAVEHKTRRILAIEVSRMPAKGMLVEKAKKYGFREDERAKGRERVFDTLKDLVIETADIKSDSNPHYPGDVKKYFPFATHKRYLGKRGASVGQGEMKKVQFDPLFSLNHTCAKLRADISRLIRKTWSTTKNPERLHAHLVLYARFHNLRLHGGDSRNN